MVLMRVIHTLDALVADMAAIPVKVAMEAPVIVARNAEQGNNEAQRIAREKSGPHGSSYFKRISAESVTPLVWEFGPAGVPKSQFVGAGYRHGRNMDLLLAADIQGPRFADDVSKLVDRLYW